MDNIKKILVDSNIFIFANIKEYPEYAVAKAKIKELIQTHKTQSTILKALELSYYSNTRINDAIIAQNAIDLDVEVFTDNIKDFRNISNLKIIPLR
ncbi:MAG: hypothetical protein MPEBLZ_01996 [Candidatus Methanoperedens nitroreducens]|uniref:PIN domain-containing protein n=1 Tax=Candidatus Methanoperedens nitratireducens TaxID=1392998 RepID=A0A0P8DZV2_9EURY|nr:hypothetical protein [Candidatus Methanoperedens sp. BLZ2]KAB2941022.1 MAG: type II toxin-antitoxin system VapC family toxin [Candidatus Methanoperedens sp.]KPQ43437.1 MAG: hypothetical protein MPEBLZ_01996 [Candidatus Methanoperedens sp. BLZ1]MBZ0174973.1 hypothetical protein [Candidatus Methanoperedens nitroreducens]CAG0993789.1 hypothetical protein METP2_02778 [Methanosarcinales archaeon]MCX9079533.1 hypothetical protein [Candidatus Methanoperedens sp.]